MRGFPFALFDLHLDAAENIVIRLHEPSRVEDEMDDMDLMQRQQGSANQQALDMTGKTEECSGFRTGHLNPDAPIFTPGATKLLAATSRCTWSPCSMENRSFCMARWSTSGSFSGLVPVPGRRPPKVLTLARSGASRDSMWNPHCPAWAAAHGTWHHGPHYPRAALRRPWVWHPRHNPGRCSEQWHSFKIGHHDQRSGPTCTDCWCHGLYTWKRQLCFAVRDSQDCSTSELSHTSRALFPSPGHPYVSDDWRDPTCGCTSATNYSLVISNHIGNSIHRAMRCTQASIFEKFMQAQQLGGRRAMPVSYGLHLVRAFQRQARHYGKSCALIMLDLKEAFYRIFRPLCMEGEVTDQSIALLMHRLPMPKDALKVLRGIMKEPCALQQAGMGWLQRRSMKHQSSALTDTSLDAAT